MAQFRPRHRPRWRSFRSEWSGWGRCRKRLTRSPPVHPCTSLNISHLQRRQSESTGVDSEGGKTCKRTLSPGHAAVELVLLAAVRRDALDRLELRRRLAGFGLVVADDDADGAMNSSSVPPCGDAGTSPARHPQLLLQRYWTHRRNASRSSDADRAA